LFFFHSLKGGEFTETGITKKFRKEIKTYKKAKQHKLNSDNILHDKWIKFGGGFYGVITFWTYIGSKMLEL
jgi:hypothetical protein